VERAAAEDWTRRLPFADPRAVSAVLRVRIAVGDLAALAAEAADAGRGRIRCFGRWPADFGDPVDWRLNPVTGERWPADVPWTSALADEARVGDVKLSWEAARFPHAYLMARAAAFAPGDAVGLGERLLDQMEAFARANPPGRGIHWFSGQEIAVRLLAWTFALDVLLSRGPRAERAAALVAEGLLLGAAFVERHLAYAEKAVYNNHLLAEALLLYLAGTLLPAAPRAAPWRERGRAILEAQAERQFYEDGAYILQSHNYARGALVYLLWACLVARAGGEGPARSWTAALARAADFLFAHQNPADGRLPNFGANDGSLPSLLSTCRFPDFRPVLQAASLVARGERLYEAGPWDEAAAWLLGVEALEAPLRARRRSSVAFAPTGYVVLRGGEESTFASLRCGSLRDRFSQIDMLHLDVFWRGHNVLADAGSYLYNGPAAWHRHFVGTASHNTVMVDGRDQMLHFRRFKNLYWTRARLLRFTDDPSHALAAGEHYGYVRHQGGCVHRRAVLLVKDGPLVVADRVAGRGRHRARGHWLGGAFPHRFEAQERRLTLDTPAGPFSVTVFATDGGDLASVSVVRGQDEPPRGWMSRHYGEKEAVPSLVAELEGECPLTLVSVLGEGRPALEPDAEPGRFRVVGGARSVSFTLRDGLIDEVAAG
jgi:asparagine synthase (glutamine-hydrolysing)